jgi:hypothetical protein
MRRRIESHDELMELTAGAVLITDSGRVVQLFDTREGRIVREIGDADPSEVQLVELPAEVLLDPSD